MAKEAKKMQPYMREAEYLTVLPDGTVKQLNPFSGTQVWTVAGRGHRPIATATPPPGPLSGTDQALASCVFCPARYIQTPPEKTRLIRSNAGGWERLERLGADQLNHSVAEFRRIPNLFEILSFDYWHANYGYQSPASVRQHQSDYLATAAGVDHVQAVVASKLSAAGLGPDQIQALSPDEISAASASFFGGGHDVVVARRHFIDGATDTSQLASAGCLTVEEHRQFISFTADAALNLAESNRYARYIAVFQNWLRPAGASIDHLHKQLVAIDERGVQHELALQRLRANPNVFNEDAANYASYRNLVIAENDHALAFAGFGHRYPTIEIYSKDAATYPWQHSAEAVAGMSDLIHALHAATGAGIPTNEEWHYQPLDCADPMPWRVMLKWRISTVAGFEGATKIYLNTIDPYSLRDRIVPELFNLRSAGRIAPLRIATECGCRPNPLRYVDVGRGY